MFHVPNKYRVRIGDYGSNDSYGNNGVFFIRNLKNIFKIIASDGEGWEHVSVSLPNRCPTWKEMCWIKNIFWDENDCIIQFHPQKSVYVNNNKYCLHLWRKINYEFPLPDSILVGFK